MSPQSVRVQVTVVNLPQRRAVYIKEGQEQGQPMLLQKLSKKRRNRTRERYDNVSPTQNSKQLTTGNSFSRGQNLWETVAELDPCLKFHHRPLFASARESSKSGRTALSFIDSNQPKSL